MREPKKKTLSTTNEELLSLLNIWIRINKNYIQTLFISRKPKRQAVQKTAVKKAPSGPTIAEMEQSDLRRLSNIKRRGRKSTKLGAEDEDLYLSIKTLLG